MKLSDITKEQEQKIPQYLNYWLSVGRRTAPVDREKATQAVNFLYVDIMKMQKPKTYLFLDSPMACQLFINSVKLKSQLWNQLESQLWSQLRNQLGNQLWSQLRNQLGNQLESQLRNQLGNQLWSQLRNQLESQLWSQLRNQELEYKQESTTNLTQAYYWHYSFILNELFPEKKKDFALFEEYLKHSKEFHHLYLYEDTAIICDFPSTLSVNEKGKLDNSYGKALEYRDGWGFYASNGTIRNSPLELELL
jgi:membrane-associated HD superfamily phosphohydrolase